MARDLTKIVVIDIESTYTRDCKTSENEIIEIGYCDFLHRSREKSILNEGSIYVKPKKITTLPPEVTEVTGIDDSMVFENGVSFGSATTELKGIIEENTWASWGDYDRRQIERQCRALNIALPFKASHINIKNLYALKHRLTFEIALDKAIRREGLTFIGTHHRGKDDAINAAILLRRLLET